MLDEPTNHLDLAAISWLANHLQNRWATGEGALLVVTHDRWFLDEVARKMWEVHGGKVLAFVGGYSAYLLARVEREQALASAEQKRKNIARRELAWLARGAKARSTKPKFRVEAAQKLIADVAPTRNSLELKRASMTRLGKQVIDLIDAGYTVDGQVILKPANWIIGAGERIGVIGENGAGKTSLLGLLDGSLKPSTGSVKIGASVCFGSLSQQLVELQPYQGMRTHQVLAQCKGSYMIDGKELTPAKLLERLGLHRSQLNTLVDDLSGGQKRRLQLLVTLLNEPNVLLLDEPGNDLDTDMLALIEDLLDSWPGTLFLVSHDRYLLERVTDNQYALIDGILRHLPGGVDEYLRILNKNNQLSEKTTSASVFASNTHQEENSNRNSNNNSNSSYLMKKQLSSIMRKLDTQEKKLADLKSKMQAIPPDDYQSLIELGNEQQQLESTIAELEEQWLAISEKLEDS
jgi:ATPase subunit of ABC transporter with duplicated ATPase domains